MYKSFRCLVAQANEGDADAMVTVVKTFTPMVKNLIRRLEDKDDPGEFFILIIEMVRKIDAPKLEDFSEDKPLIGYFIRAIRRKFGELSEKESRLQDLSCPFPIDDLPDETDQIAEAEARVFIEQMSDILTEAQKCVIYGAFWEMKKCVEMAEELGVSKQTVWEIKENALKKLLLYI